MRGQYVLCVFSLACEGTHWAHSGIGPRIVKRFGRDPIRPANPVTNCSMLLTGKKVGAPRTGRAHPRRDQSPFTCTCGLGLE